MKKNRLVSSATIILIIICIFLTACSSSSSVTNGTVPTPQIESRVYISQSTSLPIVDGNLGGTLYLLVTNASNYNLLLTAKSIIANQSSESVNTLLKSTTDWDGNFNTDQCAKLVANSSCIIQLTPVHNNGGALITLDFSDINREHHYTAKQVFSYTKVVSSVNGFYVNGNLGSVANQGFLSIAIPFVLAQDFSSLEVLHQSAISSSQIICPGNSYTKGNTCTALIVQRGNWSNHYKLSGIGTLGKLSSQNITQTVLAANQPNLLVSGVNVYINPSDGSASQTISILNSGNVAATTVTPIASTSVGSATINLTNNSCATLQPLDSCTFNINVNSELNGNGLISIDYSPHGLNILPVFNVIFIAPTPAPSLSIFTDNLNGLLNTTENTTNSLLVTFSNNGNKDLTGLTFNSLPNPQFVYSNSDVSQACALDGTQILTISQSCSVLVNYTPTTPLQTGQFIIMPKATYLDTRGQEATYQSASQTYNYSSITQSSLSFQLVSGQVNPVIGANGSNTSSQNWVITNNGATTATNVYMSLLPSDTQGALSVTNNCGTAVNKISLSPTQSCAIDITYGPSSISRTLNEAMAVNYVPSISSLPVEISPTPWTVTFTKAAIVATLTGNASTTWGDLSGNGTSNLPYQFVTSTGNLLQFTLNYANTGNQDATQFNVAANQLPVGYNIIGGTCPTLTNTQTLPAGDSCNLIVGVVDSQIALYFYPTGVVNVNIPSFSYNDSSTGVNQATSSGDIVYVTANSWGSVINNVVVGPSPIYQITITFTLASLANISGLAPVTVDIGPYLANLKFTPSQTTCQLGGTSPNTCQITLTPQVYISGTYNIRYLYTNSKVVNDYQVGTVNFNM